MAIKFLHLADVHLDTPFKNREKGVREVLREGVRQAFRKAIDLALDRQVDAVLVAGDLFDNDTLSFATEKFLLEQINRLRERGVPFFYAPGNHDPWGGSFRLGNIPWPDNVTVFNSRKPYIVEIKDATGQVKGIICGAGHKDSKEGDNLASNFPPIKGGAPGIGLLHALVTGSQDESNHDSYAPCTLDDLRIDGYCYWALGHVHTKSELLDDPYVVYPGNIVGRHYRESGERGAYLVEIDDNKNVRAQFCPLAPYVWLNVNVINLDEVSTYDDLKEEIVKQAFEAIREANSRGKINLRVSLSGPCFFYKELIQEEESREQLLNDIKSALDIEFLELDYASLSHMVNIDEYRQGPHVLATALDIIQTLKEDEALLLELAPEKLAGMKKSGSEQEKISYLRSLLTDLDVEAAVRMVEEEKK